LAHSHSSDSRKLIKPYAHDSASPRRKYSGRLQSRRDASH
jgi:hypothetical protein